MQLTLRAIETQENVKIVKDLLERLGKGRVKRELLSVKTEIITATGLAMFHFPPSFVGFRKVGILTVTFGQNSTKEFDLIEMMFRMEIGSTFLGRVDTSRYYGIIS